MEKQTPAKRKVGDGTPGPGRKKGIPNKMTTEVKSMILEALQGVGGVSYLQERANDPRTAAAFLSLVGKVLPLQVTGEDGGPVETNLTVTFRKP